MNLTTLNDVRIDGANQALLNDLAPLLDSIRAARPLSSAVVHRLRNELLGDQVHNSNAIEGNTLSLRETRTVLEMGHLADVGRQRDILEASNLGKAIEAVQSTIPDAVRMADEAYFRDVHRILFTGLNDDIAGSYRTVRVVVTGAKHQPPREVEKALRSVFNQLKVPSSPHPVVTAAWAHWAIARLHPFEDGNGRMARLWQDYILLANEHTPAIIPKSQQKEYYASLQAADDGDFTQLIQLVAQSAIATSQVYVNAIRESDEVGGWADALVNESDQLADETNRLEYSRWHSRVVELRDAFLRCLTLLNRKSSHLDFDLHSYDIIDMSTWESLRSEAHAPHTWCFRIVARSDAGNFQYVVFAGRHSRTPLDDLLGNIGKQVSLLVSEKVGVGESVILADANSPVTLREVLVHNNEFIRKRWDAAQQTNVYDRRVSALQIAQDFLTEVVRHRLVP